jgi:hypothetical protein
MFIAIDMDDERSLECSRDYNLSGIIFDETGNEGF